MESLDGFSMWLEWTRRCLPLPFGPRSIPIGWFAAWTALGVLECLGKSASMSVRFSKQNSERERKGVY